MVVDINMNQIQGMIRAGSYLEERLGSDAPISFIGVILRIPYTGEIQVTDLRRQLNITGAGVSRTLAAMCGYNTAGRRKLPTFCIMKDDPKDRRYKTVALTDEGRKFVFQLLARFEGSII